jgi:hypothetical protein
MITADDADGKLPRVLRVEFKFQDLTLSSSFVEYSPAQSNANYHIESAVIDMAEGFLLSISNPSMTQIVFSSVI